MSDVDERRLSQLSPGEDPHGLAPLFQSAKSAPEEELPRLYWRLRTSLGYRRTRPRRILRVALTAGLVFLAGGAVGAVLRPYWGSKPGVPAAKPEPPAKAAWQTARNRAIASAADVQPAQPEVVPDVASAPPLVEPMAKPLAPRRALQRVVSQTEAVPPLPQVATAPQPPSPVAIEQGMLAQSLTLLRKKRDPRAALALLDEHSQRFPGSALGPETAMLRSEALLGLGRNGEALSVLDQLSSASMPNRNDRLVLRGELRAAAGRWQEARVDFESVLSNLASGTAEAKFRDLRERALWGRASARSHLGDDAGARTDLALYLRSFPSGRFAGQAAILLQGTP